MYLTYGTTTLAVIDLNRYERTNVYSEDGTDLLYVKHLIGVSAVYSPGGMPQQPSVTDLSPATRATLGGTDYTSTVLTVNPRGQDPTGVNTTPSLESDFPGIRAPITSQYTGIETDAELRYRLLAPRQSLTLWGLDRQTSAFIRWLESPRPGFTVDCKNGPKPISCDVITADGETSLGVFFQIETYTQPCPQGSDRLVLSHRWTMRHTHDERNYLTRVVEGTIVFNSEVIYATGIRPDWVRNQFIHPIPLGYQRRVPLIEATSDGLDIHYIVTDTDPTIVFEPADSGATSIDIVETLRYTIPVENKILNNALGNSTVRSIIKTVAAFEPFNPFTRIGI